MVKAGELRMRRVMVACFFFTLIVVSVFVHEGVHVLQYWKMGIPVNEVVFLGVKLVNLPGNSSQWAGGWVLAGSRLQLQTLVFPSTPLDALSRQASETEAYSFQFLFVIVAVMFLNKSKMLMG